MRYPRINVTFRRVAALTPLAAVSLLSACAPTVSQLRPRPVTSVASVQLHNHKLTLHLTAPPADSRRILLVYATGDGGWWGKDRDVYTHLSEWGYAAVGFSAREYVHHLGKDALLPREVALDYEAIIRTAESALGLPPPTRIVLVGKSRGAGLAVAAAGPQMLKPLLAGILAVGLTGEEEYVHRLRRARPRQLVMLQTYSYLPQLGEVPVAVIQSTRDKYVPADEARRLFGPDTPSRELVAIDSDDHDFGGKRERLYDEMERSLQWLVQR
jgi:fermentation-respiration switch protein FrsA (DUF1100 family)